MKLQKITVVLVIIFFITMGNVGFAKPVNMEKSGKLIVKDVFSKDWTLREDLPVFSNPNIESLQADIYQKDAKLRIAFSVSDEKNTDCTLHFHPMYFFVVGKPILVDIKSGDKQEIDYKFENEHLFFKVTATADIQYLEFGVASRKLQNLGSLTIEDKIKQARTIRRIKQQLDSWSPLAPNHIIAQEVLRPIISHGGYAVNGTKKAVIWANNTNLTGKFELIDALNNVQHPDPQPVVYSGNLQETSAHIWGGKNYIADFTDFKKEGLYFVRLKVAETREVADSYVFPIRKALYFDLAKKAAGWFYYQRCGVEVPGFHKACHTEDAVIKIDGTKVDVTGGWHDAGDYGKWTHAGATGVVALAMFQDEFGNELKTGSCVPELIDEAAWEAEYFCKTFWNEHFYPGFTFNLENVCAWLGAPECEPPRIAREAAILDNDYPYYRAPGLGLISSSLGKVARQVLPYNKELSEKCIAIAKEVYEIDSRVKLEEKGLLNAYLSFQAGCLLNDLELFKLVKDEKYEKDAQKRVKNILIVTLQTRDLLII